VSAVLFWIFALAACGGAVAVVVERNVVRMAFWLVVALGSAAGLFFLLGADFLGATQLLIYVGGTIVLLIFGVMLTAAGPMSRATAVRPSERLLAGVIAASLLCVFGVSVLGVESRESRVEREGQGYAEGGTTRALGLKLMGMDSERLAGRPGTGVGYLLPFEIASVHLLVVLIGAAYLARAKRRTEGRENGRI
jgi:NADH:ubiquinone oxidoreductase subunit 6 (subunit J)